MKKQNGNQKVSNMKRHLLYGFLFALVAAGCYQEELSVTPQTDCEGRTYTASFEDNETRTYVEDDVLLRWTAGDQISLFDGNTLNRQYKFDGETGDNSGTFSIVDAPYGSGNDLTANYAVYPYASGVKISESGVITAALPAEQTYAENSFGPGANTMVAVTKDKTDTFLRFKNVCGYLKLQLYGKNVTVKSITLTGNNNEKVAGAAAITPSYSGTPTVSMAEDATGTITLDCGEGVRIGTTSETVTAFWIAVPPTTFDEGFEVTITDTDGGTFTKSTSKKISIERNVVKPMAAFEVNMPINPVRQIWYTATQKVTPYNSGLDVFGANIISNEWDPSTQEGVITFDSDVTKIGYQAFRDRSSLLSIKLPDAVTSIENHAFVLCSGLETVTIPDSVTEIDGQPFYNCHNIKAFYGKFASEDNHSLIVNGVLKKYASNCSDSVCSVPDDVNVIEEYAFYGSSNLTDITISDNVRTIGKGAFYGCDNLTDLIFGANVTSIGGSAFCSCTSLVNLVIPDSVTLIEDHSFQYCTGLTYVMIGSGVTGIRQSAFDGCSSLKDVYCKPLDPPSVGVNVFSGNASDRKIYVPYTSFNNYIYSWGVAYEDVFIAYDFDKGTRVQQNNEIWYTASSEFELAYDQMDVSIFGARIVSSEWDRNTEMGIIKFSAAVNKIGEDAFKSFTYQLTSISIPPSVEYIEASAFAMCRNLTSVNMPERLVTIGDSAFDGCSSLTSITIPESVSSIGSNAFYGCKSLERFYGKYADEEGRALIKDNTIISYACASGTAYAIPEGVTGIGENVFNGCTGLTSVTIPAGVTTIGDSAFWNCSSLTTLTVPGSVIAIAGWAFYSCKKLESVFVLASDPPTLGYSAFEENAAERKFYVPSGSVSAYMSAGNWSKYASDIVEYDYSL